MVLNAYAFQVSPKNGEIYCTLFINIVLFKEVLLYDENNQY
jgi:hypothetical protein